MARYTGAVCRQCRREVETVFLKASAATLTSARFAPAPGQHGPNQMRKKVASMACSCAALKAEGKTLLRRAGGGFAHWLFLLASKSGIAVKLLRVSWRAGWTTWCTARALP